MFWLACLLLVIMMGDQIAYGESRLEFRMERISFRDLVAYKYRLFDHDVQLTFHDFFALLSDAESSIHTVFYHALREFPVDAFFWECAPVTASTWASQAFEFVLIEARELARRTVNPRPFFQQFEEAAGESAVVSFMSLGKDAKLVVPVPPAKSLSLHDFPQHFTHLASFMRSGSPAQVSALWRQVGIEASIMLESARSNPLQPLWLSTSGLGVSWLHIRLDSVPKYYNWEEYKHMRGVRGK